MNKKIIITSLIVVLSIASSVLMLQERDMVDLINEKLAMDPSSSGQPAFALFDATKFTDSNYPWLGFPVTVINERELLGVGDHENQPPDELKVKTALIKYKNKKRIILNIPSWKLTSVKDEDLLVDLHIKWYQKVIQCVKEVIPGADVGILDVPYSPWKALKSTNRALHEYQQVYKRLKPVIDVSDTLYPQIKVFSNDQNDLIHLMGVQLYIAKILEKPVYPVVSHKKLVNGSDYNQILPVALIKEQCDFVRKNADGMVWWTENSEPWQDDWYQAVYEHCFL